MPVIIVKTNEFRAPAYRSPPEFFLNGQKTELQVRNGPDNIVEYLLTGLDWSGESSNRLDVVAAAFNPKKAMVSGDDRDFGINVIGVEVNFD